MSPDAVLDQFEGLIAETARQILDAGVELEADDVRQLLRIKAWRAIQLYDPARTARGMTLRRWVFGCLYNLRKDLVKRPRRYNSSVDAARESGDWFEQRYLSVEAESVYREVEEEPIALPSTLTAIERQVVVLRLEGRLLSEIDREVGLSRAHRERVVRSIREKLADWAPSPAVRAGQAPARALSPPVLAQV